MLRALTSSVAVFLFASTALCQVTIPPHASVYNGFSRGFNFTAATNFNIVQLELPLNAQQTGDTSGFLVRVNGATVLRSVGNATPSIPANIPIAIGDIVDVIGNWSPALPGNFTAHNSYGGPAPFATTIEGVAHTLLRCGWQWDIADPLYTSAAFLAATTGNMGRVLMYTSAGQTGTVLATATSVGTGCVSRASATFYETFAASTFDLSNSSVMLMPTANGYVALPGGSSWWTPVGTNLGLTDDSVSAALPLGFTLNYPGGSTSNVYASSNGFVWAQSSTVNGCCTGNPAQFVSGAARWSMLWNDLNPGVGGTVIFDQDVVNGAAYLTYTAVPEYGQAANLNNVQIAFFATGMVEYRYQACSITAHQVLTGWTPGVTQNPGSVDISASMPIITQPDLVALALASNPRPIGGTVVNLTSSNLTATAPFGAIVLGFNNPALDLTPLGMPGCTQYTDALATLLYLPFGAPSVVTPFTVPNLPGLHIFAQSFLYDPTTGATPLGATASNGIDLRVGDY